MKYSALTLTMCVSLCASRANSQTFTTLLQFSGTSGAANGKDPVGGLTLSGTTLYGMTESGGVSGLGNIFSLGTNGANYQNLLSFTGTGGAASGARPDGSLTLSGTTLYGTTSGIGIANYFGNVFSVGSDGTSYENLVSFTGNSGTASGWEPLGGLTLSGTTLFGVTYLGGTIFGAGTDGGNFQNLVSIGGMPVGTLVRSGTTLYGMTETGGGSPYRYGNIFSVGADGTNYENLVSFTGAGGTASGWNPVGSLLLGGTTLYGMTFQGGAKEYGNIFSVGIDGTDYQNLLSFTGTNGTAIGDYPNGGLILSGTTIYGMTSGLGLEGFKLGYGNIFSVGIDGSNYHDLYNFTGGAGGQYPSGDLLLSGGTLFGVTYGDSPIYDGTVFALTIPEPGTLALAGAGAVALVSYRWRRRRIKYLALTVALGVALCTRRADSQTFKTLVQFTGTGGTASGESPEGSLTLAGTTLYGMTTGSTDIDGQLPYGSVFSVGINGTNYQNLVSFTGTGGTANGHCPYGSLTLVGTTLYGMTTEGGNGGGNIFCVGTNGTGYQNLVSLTSWTGTAVGNHPMGSLTLCGTSLYGMTYSGGYYGYGNIFSVGTNGTGYRNLLTFNEGSSGALGEHPNGSLTLVGTALYGMTETGGDNGDNSPVGNVFCIGSNGTNYNNLLSFTGNTVVNSSGTANGGFPLGSLTNSGTTLYGMTSAGGYYVGNVFSIGTNGSNYKNLYSMTGGSGGDDPCGSLILSGTTLYGLARGSGGGSTYAYGNIFSIGIDGSDYQDLYSFTGGADGDSPNGDLTLSGGTLFGTTSEGGVGIYYGTVFALVLPTPTPEPGALALVGAAAVVLVSYRWRWRRMKYLALMLALGVALCTSRADSQAFKTLVEFTGTGGTASGEYGIGKLSISGTRLYGMTNTGGANGDGTVFSVGVDGANFQNLVSFTGTSGTASGDDPQNGNLTLIDTTLYGMTEGGGAYGYGTLFSVGTNGAMYQNLISFTGAGGTAAGAYPFGSLTLSGTTLYGMTSESFGEGYGNIFSVGTNGTNYQNLVSFSGSGGGAATGLRPYGNLTLAGTTLYGMTYQGGANGYGNVFSVGTNGRNFQNLAAFTGTAGTAPGLPPQGSLTLDGTTLYGMTSGYFNDDFYGSVFSVGTNGASYHDLLSFTGTSGAAIGSVPRDSLTLTGTTLYGMTFYGGTDGHGNIFSVGIDGSDCQDLYDFTGGVDGGYPAGDLTLSGGTLFGMTSQRGANGGPTGYGTVFALVLPTRTPEPGTLALVGSGAVVLVLYRWRRLKNKKRRRP